MKIFTVSELGSEIKKHMEARFRNLSVQGEISNYKPHSSGHSYFTLKDKDAQISAILFKGSGRGLSRMPRDGDRIVAVGEITVYPPRGEYRFIVREIRYVGVGELLAELRARKEKLQALGYFAKERKKTLPPFPSVIGVITSPTGAVIQDILNVLQRRHAGFQLLLYPVKVQGEGAKEEIATAIDECNRYRLADVLIVARGGGSLEDLLPFNEELVAEAIFRSTIPVISAVGHETDFSISDFVADVRAPTPSAAAEIVLGEKRARLEFLQKADKTINQALKRILFDRKKRMDGIKKQAVIVSPYLLVSRKLEMFDEQKQKILFSFRAFFEKKHLSLLALDKQKQASDPRYKLRIFKEQLRKAEKGLVIAVRQFLRNQNEKFDEKELRKRLKEGWLRNTERKISDFRRAISLLQAMNPKNLFTKGYCILFSENKDSVILSSRQVRKGQSLTVVLQDGTLKTNVEEIFYDNGRNDRL